MRYYLLAALAALAPRARGAPPPVDERVSALLAQMTTAEQIVRLRAPRCPLRPRLRL
jgi:hypothetical protein